MKVSSDACIFGAWIPVPQTQDARILDIGAGTGLLSLMLAQRHDSATIDALELDAGAAGQAAENCADSIFAGRIKVHQCDARTFSSQNKYDLIVSNPPFFKSSLKGPDAARNAARHSDSLDLASLFEKVEQLLNTHGAFALLMPHDAEPEILQTAAQHGLHCARKLAIRDNEVTKIKRGCWLFQREPVASIDAGNLLVRLDGCYSPAFRELLRSYYLLL